MQDERRTRTRWFVVQLLAGKLYVGEYDIFMAAMLRDGAGHTREHLDEAYDKYTSVFEVPDIVVEFCKAVLNGVKPYVHADGTTVVLT